MKKLIYTILFLLSFVAGAATENFSVNMRIIEGITIRSEVGPDDSSIFEIKASEKFNLSISVTGREVGARYSYDMLQRRVVRVGSSGRTVTVVNN